MRRATTLLLALTAATTAIAAPATAADDSAAVRLPITASPEGGTIDLDTATVSHFGYDGERAFNSPSVKATHPKAADPAHWLPVGLIASARTAAPARDGFVCTIWVGEVVADGLRDIKAGTHQTCTGSFRTQWTQAQFASQKGGWHRITNSIIGPRTSRQINDTTFVVSCRANPRDGRQNYRLEGRGYAIATNGVEVKGNLHYGRASRWTCL
ncbi:hypothetical protein [Streptomyces sp. NPDC046887]|uniref:hypothetical protein n=1 Tax=Streptomyces sp. NPDC046887 TaxID=3155472 RepID=UPI00340D4EF3